MPSLKMKTKSSTDCFKETLLSVCQKSTIISKNSYSCHQSSQIANLDTSIRDYPDVPPSTEVSIQDIRCDEAANLEEFLDTNTDDFQLQNQEFFFIDPTTLERMEFTPGHSQSNFETFFSPLGECIEAHNVTNVHNDAVILDDPDMPQLRANDIDGNRNSRANQTCTVSDFYISDMIVTGIPPDGNVMYSNVGSNLYHDYQRNESTLLFNMAEHYVLLPFLEDAVEKNYTRDAKSHEEALKESDDSGLCLQIDQLKPYYQDSDANFNLVSYQAECFNPHDMIEDLPDLLDASTFLPPTSTKEPCKKKAITLVLDLDETLVHSTLEQCDGADFSFPVFFNMKEHTVKVKQRPFLKAFMERVTEMFDIVIFTASESIYADQLLDILDPDGKLICRRFYRESCTFSNDIYTKDLTILGVDLAKVAIIDNSPQVFQLQVNNGIPIESWFDDPSDRALISLLPFLETLLEADDVRPIIANRFGNKE